MPTELQRRPDWQCRLRELVNTNGSTSLVYGDHDCAKFARAAIEAVSGTALLVDVDLNAGRIASARALIAHGWRSVEEMADDLLPSIDLAASRPGDIVSFDSNGLAVRVGDGAVTPAADRLVEIPRSRWHRAWKVG